MTKKGPVEQSPRRMFIVCGQRNSSEGFPTYGHFGAGVIDEDHIGFFAVEQDADRLFAEFVICRGINDFWFCFSCQHPLLMKSKASKVTEECSIEASLFDFQM